MNPLTDPLTPKHWKNIFLIVGCLVLVRFCAGIGPQVPSGDSVKSAAVQAEPTAEPVPRRRPTPTPIPSADIRVRIIDKTIGCIKESDLRSLWPFDYHFQREKGKRLLSTGRCLSLLEIDRGVFIEPSGVLFSKIEIRGEELFVLSEDIEFEN